ncbi:hypothetical protein ACGFXC_05160 [Streptomyces sp. NPDC048507]|uniref:hypothetical protein n=1 Tax=Streptomyces sp. NPDC048507 TaxID=3365560 RepID=UPI0037223923
MTTGTGNPSTGKSPPTDDQFAYALMTLRRYIGAPLPATGRRSRATLRTDPERIRIRLADPSGQAATVDLPTRYGREQGTWWYAGALRHTAAWLTPATLPPTADDGIDYLIADLAGDPLWQNAMPSIAPALYILAGFDHHHPDTVRVYLDHDDRTIGIDLAVRDTTGAPRTVGWWAYTKLAALLRPVTSRYGTALHQPRGSGSPHAGRKPRSC